MRSRRSIENDAVADHLGAASFEEILQFRCVADAIVFAIELEPNAAAGRKLTCDVIKEKIPFLHSPKARHLMIVETNHVRGDEIEFFSEIGQGNKSAHAPDDALNAEHRNRFVEHRHVVDIQTNGVVSQQFADVEKISAARSDIENAAATAEIELKIANSLQVGFEPGRQIEIFGRRVARIIHAITRPYFFKLLAIDGFDDRVRAETFGDPLLQKKTPQTMIGAFEGGTSKKFSDFVREAHAGMSRFVVRWAGAVNRSGVFPALI